jgi:hypothetical protein
MGKWHANGTQVARKWHANGTQMARKWHANGTQNYFNLYTNDLLAPSGVIMFWVNSSLRSLTEVRFEQLVNSS